MTSIITKTIIKEALSFIRKKAGEEKFKETLESSPHIQQIIKYANELGGQSKEKLLSLLKNEVLRMEQYKNLAPNLYDTMSKNAVEHAAFNFLDFFTDKPEFQQRRVKFDIEIWKKLLDMIRREHPGFHPLYSPGRFNIRWKIDWTLVPSKDKEDAKYNTINTAAVYPDGVFVFNKNFLQKCMDFETIEKPVIQSKKYQVNGGPIPDAYFYVEWVVLHEILHYSYGDFDNFSRLKQYPHKVHNIASDLRSNYTLAISGYGQLPGFYVSDLINHHRQPKYEDLVKIVDSELKNLPKEIQDKLQPGDEHTTGDNSGEPGSGEPGSGEPGSGPGSGEYTPGEEDVEYGKSKSGESGQTAPGTSSPSNQDVNDIQQDVLSRMSKKQEFSPGTNSGSSEDNVASVPGKMTVFSDLSAEVKKEKPSVNWKTMLRQVVVSSAKDVDVDWSTPDPRGVAYQHVAKDLGAVPIIPAKKKVDFPMTKICLVLDTSYSMMTHYPKVLAEAQTLVSNLQAKKSNIAVCMFSDKVAWFEINLKNNTFWQVSDPAELEKNPDTKITEKNWKKLLGKGSTGATYFTSTMANQLSNLAANGYNIMLFTDSDIINSSVNWNNFMSVYKKYPSKIFYIVDRNTTYQSSVEKKNEDVGKAFSVKNWTTFEKR